MTRPILALALGAALAIATPASAAIIPLYDSSLDTTPDAQGWFAGADVPQGASFGAAVVNDVLLFNSLGNTDTKAGFALPLFGTLNPASGFTLAFSGLTVAEAHDSNDRAGFSILVISNDSTKAVELGFWNDQIFIQNGSPNLFTHGTTAFVDMTRPRTIHLVFTPGGNDFWLFVDGQYAMGGPLQDYTASTATFAGVPVYSASSFVFFGDNTTSAEVFFTLQDVALADPIPEPASLGLLAMGALALLRRR